MVEDAVGRYKSKGLANGRPVFRGKRGGLYYLRSSGKKAYVKEPEVEFLSSLSNASTPARSTTENQGTADHTISVKCNIDVGVRESAAESGTWAAAEHPPTSIVADFPARLMPAIAGNLAVADEGDGDEEDSSGVVRSALTVCDPERLCESTTARQAPRCKYYELCKEYIESLDQSFQGYLDPSHDRCFCISCLDTDKTGPFSRGGRKYALPHGWVRFGTTVNRGAAKAQDVWRSWPVSFHGTSSAGIVQGILKTSGLVLPGDILGDGTEIKIRDGHIPEENWYFTSPSIEYSGLDTYATSVEWTSKSGRSLRVKHAVQLRQEPGTFEVQGQTVGGWKARFWGHPVAANGSRIAKHLPDDALEWRSRRRGVVMPYGVLVQIEDPLKLTGEHERDCPRGMALQHELGSL